jgi:CBS domain-containing protein
MAASEEAARALGQLSQRDVDQIPVVAEDGRLQGLVRRQDIMKWLRLQTDAGA